MQMQLSNSEMSTWARCPRQWFIEYFLGYGPAEENPVGSRQLGVRIHTALQAHYGHQLPALVVLNLLYQIEISAHPEFETELKSELSLALTMVDGYLKWAEEEGHDADLQLVSTEADVSVPLPNMPEVTLRGRLDQAVLQSSTGYLFFLDFKTSATFDAHEVLYANPQFRLYSLIQFLASGQGEPVTGMQLDPNLPVVMGGIMRTLRRVKRTSRSTPPYYATDSVRFPVEVLDSTLSRTRQIAGEIIAARERLAAIYAAGGSLQEVNQAQRTLCRQNYIASDCDWRCPASKGLCVAMDDGSDWGGILVRSGRYVQRDPYARYADDPIASIREKIASP